MARATSTGKNPATPLETAIDWMVLLRSGEAGPGDVERHRAWCAADPRHASAWAKVSGATQAAVEPLRVAREASAAQGAALRSALLHPPRLRRRRVAGGLLALAGVALGAGWLARREGLLSPLPAYLADLRTGTGERRNLALEDGSQLLLNARSAVDLAFTGAERRLRLREGALIVTVALDAARAFVVESAQGSVRALGTRFMVRQDEGHTLVAVLQHSVLVRSRAGVERRLREGEALYFDAMGIDTARPPAGDPTAWEHGMLAVDDQPLAEVIDALRPYLPGVVRVAPEAARLRVLGAFPLDAPERALESLAQTLPIRITRHGSWLTRIEARQPTS